MAKHFEAVEADFRSYYGLDLRAVCWGPDRFGVRRIRSLVRGLPVGGATSRIQTNGQAWTTTDELLASVVELIDHSNRMFFSANAKKGAQVWKPIHIARPQAAEEPREPKLSTRWEVYKFFGDHTVYEGADN